MEDKGLTKSQFKINLIELASNIKRLRTWNIGQREIKLEEAKKINPENLNRIEELVLDLCYDRKFCKDAGINYNNIRKNDSRLIKTAIADYLLEKI